MLRKQEMSAARKADFFSSVMRTAMVFGLVALLITIAALIANFSFWPSAAVAFFFLILVGPPATILELYYDHRYRRYGDEAIAAEQIAALHGEISWDKVSSR